ncbi:Polycystin-1 [Manis javanica]|nr:Polycystin-1 [Manis javanica]
MAFQTQAGAQIPIGQLASEHAITVKVPSSSDQVAQGPRVSSSSVVIPPRPRGSGQCFDASV